MHIHDVEVAQKLIEKAREFPNIDKFIDWALANTDLNTRQMEKIWAQTQLVPPALLETVVDYDRAYSLDQLRQMCKASGLGTSGDKKTLGRRLMGLGRRA